MTRIFRIAPLVLILALAAGPFQTDSNLSTRDAGLFAKSVDQLLIEHYQEEAIKEKKAPEDFFIHQRLQAGTVPSIQMLRRAAEQSRALGARTAAASPRLGRARWNYIGPSSIGARVADMVTDVDREGVLYVASASGGMWKSTDAGKTFKSIWKKSRVQSMGALAMAKNGTLYLGTGEANPGGGSITYAGNGVYKSTDRGKTWKNIGLKNSVRIGRIAVDPTDPKHVLVAVTGHLFVEGGPRGLYETKNGGKSWERILKPEGKTTGAVDVAIDPHDPKNILVAMWDHFRFPDYRRYTGPDSGIWRSTNGGKDFTELGPTNGLPLATRANGGRIGVAFDHDKQTDKAYAVYANNEEGAFAHWFVSNDNGNLWIAPPQAQLNLAGSQSVYGWWFGRVYVDPKDANHVYLTGLQLYESKNGGLAFPDVHTAPHVDHHAMAWAPDKKNRVYNGNDGGVYRSEENGSTTSWIHADSQPWSQFFRIDISPQDPSRINGGLQDQGSVRSWGPTGWDQYNGGDGVENVINPRDKENIFACSQYGACLRSDDGGNRMEDMVQTSARYGWLTPIVFRPGSGKVMYWAGDSVHRSQDRGQTWERISPDLGEGDIGRETNPLYAGHYGTVQAIGLTKAKPNIIYAGTDNNRLWKTTDGGGTWNKIEHDNLPKKWVTDIVVANENHNRVFVTFSGYREGDGKSYVAMSKNGGDSWSMIGGGLPNAPVNDAEKIRKKLYVATDVGIFMTRTGRINWKKVGRGLPLVPINAVHYVRTNDSLYAGTFGRGIWKVSLPG